MPGAQRIADALTSVPLRVPLLRVAHRMRQRWPDGPARGFENQIKDAITRRGSEVVDVPVLGGRTMAVDLGDSFHQRIAATGRYEPAITDLFSGLFAPGKVFFDVGANAGYYSTLAAGLGATVQTFEPNPAMAALIRRNADPSVTLNEVAVGATEGEVTFNLSPNPTHSGISSVEALPELAGGRKLRVPITTIDAHCARHGIRPDIIKIDVESHEAAVVEGMRELLRTTPPAHVVIELRRRDGSPDPADTAQVLLDAGYRAAVLSDTGPAAPYAPELLDSYDNVHFSRPASPA